MTRKPNGPYLIESSPNYRKRRACLAVRRMALIPVSILCAAITGYRDELHHMLDADAVYLGPGK